MKKTVVYCSDGRDMKYLLASIFSVKKNLGEDTEIFVLTEKISSHIPGATVLNVAQYMDNFGMFPNKWGRRWPYSTLLRLAIPVIDEFKDKDSVLYLDTDTLVLSPEVANLFTTEAGDSEILAAPDSNGKPSRVDKCIRQDLCQEAIAPVLMSVWKARSIANHKYVNAGVSVWVLKNIIANGIDWYIQRVKWFWDSETRGGFDFLDQDFINSMMVTRCVFDRRFNNFADTDCSSAVVKHYILRTKSQMESEAEEFLGYTKPDYGDRYLVYASDGNDADRLKMSLFSARKHIDGNVKAYVLTDLTEYPGVEDITLLNPQKQLADLGFTPVGWSRKWPYSCLYRLALPFLDELRSVNQILYLDTDTLIRSSDINRLFTVDSNGFEAYGVPDLEKRQWDIEGMMSYDISGVAWGTLNDRLWSKRSTLTHSYINSGVLLLFLDQIRKNGLDWYCDRLKWFWQSVTRRGFGFPDQGFINLMMDVSPTLSVRFNRFGGDANTNCIIQHFVGGHKHNMLEVAKSMGYVDNA